MVLRKLCIGAAIMVIGLAACGPRAQQAPTVVVQVPTAAPTPTRLPSATPAPTAAPITAPEGVGGGGAAAFVVLVNYTFNPPKVMVADPLTGAEQTVFDAPGLSPLSSPKVGGAAIFYLDDQTSIVRRVDFDGAITELPFISSGGDYFEGDFLPSPDGRLIAWGTSTFEPDAGNATHMMLKVAQVDGSNEQTLLDQTIVDDSLLPQPIQWSPDSRYFYFTNIPYGIGGYILFGGGPDLQRVEVATGEIVEILPNTGCLCPMAVSPDGATVAAIVGIEPLSLLLRDIATGAERTVEIDIAHRQAGSLVWSADGTELLYTMAISNFENPEAEQFAIVRVDAATLSQTTVVADNDSLFRSMAWPAPEVVWVNDKNGNSWLLNPDTGEMTQTRDGFSLVK